MQTVQDSAAGERERDSEDRPTDRQKRALRGAEKEQNVGHGERGGERENEKEKACVGGSERRTETEAD